MGFAAALLAEALVLAELWALAWAFELPISLPTLAGVTVGMGVAQLLPIPAALGSLEATEVGIVSLAGGAAPLGLAVGLLVRLRETFVDPGWPGNPVRRGLDLDALADPEEPSAIVPKG
jgi:uncharacterized membrane protein YbhN (UPF0104 family)